LGESLTLEGLLVRGKWQTISEVTGRYTSNGYKVPEYKKVWSRVERAILQGYAGNVIRVRRQWLLTESNIGLLERYLRERWSMEPLKRAAV
jgi:hypothetical protein